MVKRKPTCAQIIKRRKLTAEKLVGMVFDIGVKAIKRKYKLTSGQYYIIKKLLNAQYPNMRNYGKISKEYLREMELKRKTQEILPSTPEEYHKFYYENVSPAEQRRRRKGYEGFFKFYGK